MTPVGSNLKKGACPYPHTPGAAIRREVLALREDWKQRDSYINGRLNSPAQPSGLILLDRRRLKTQRVAPQTSKRWWKLPFSCTLSVKSAPEISKHLRILPLVLRSGRIDTSTPEWKKLVDV